MRPNGCGPLSSSLCVVWPYFLTRGRIQTVKGVRKLVTRKCPYLVYYTVDDEAGEVVILAIQHAARDREHEDA